MLLLETGRKYPSAWHTPLPGLMPRSGLFCKLSFLKRISSAGRTDAGTPPVETNINYTRFGGV